MAEGQSNESGSEKVHETGLETRGHRVEILGMSLGDCSKLSRKVAVS